MVLYLSHLVVLSAVLPARVVGTALESSFSIPRRFISAPGSAASSPSGFILKSPAAGRALHGVRGAQRSDNRAGPGGPVMAVPVAGTSTLSGAKTELHAHPDAAARAAPERLRVLREVLTRLQVDAVLVDDADAHGSEIPCGASARRSYLNGFDGSNGLALVTQNDALLWTDGRYFVQAEKQLCGECWTLMRQGTPKTPTLEQYLKEHTEIRRIGVHSFTTSVTLMKQLEQSGFVVTKCSEERARSPAAATAASEHLSAGTAPVAEAAEECRRIIMLKDNPVDELWGVARPAEPASQVVVHPEPFRGQSTRDKMEKVVREMRAEGTDVLLLSSLDDVAWLTNLRGEDIEYSPIFYSYALVAQEGADAAGEAGAAAENTSSSHQNADAAAAEGRWRLLVYTARDRVSSQAAEELAAQGAILRDYDMLCEDLRQILCGSSSGWQGQPAVSSVSAIDKLLAGSRGSSESKECVQSEHHTPVHANPKVWLEPKVNVAVYGLVSEYRPILLKETPVAVAKAAKDATEMVGFVEAHEIDGVALATFFCWLEKQINANAAAAGTTAPQCLLTEWTLKEAVDAARNATSTFFRGPSFSTISSLGSNCAVTHYRPQEKSSLRLGVGRGVDGSVVVEVLGGADDESTNDADPGHDHTTKKVETPMFLLDSGGQYLGGTTDVTRTLHLGEPSEEQRRAFTLVLKGVIALSTQRFPEGVKGPQLDALARQHLWNEGLDYLHGTGHGVGHYLNVHEGPIGISPRLIGAPSAYELREGAVLSIEPGFYKDGDYGIRIENLAAVKKTPMNYRGRSFLGFSTLTLAPIQLKLIDKSLLSTEELKWLNSYHADVFARVSRRLLRPGLNNLPPSNENLSQDDTMASEVPPHQTSTDASLPDEKTNVFRPPLAHAVSVTNAEVTEWLRDNTKPF